MYIKDIVSLWLRKMNVSHIFGIPGSYVLPLLDSATRKGLTFILSQHEYGAALMADGYVKAGGAIPCVITTTGIGATNALSGLYNSYSDSQPVIFITGQVPTSQFGKGALQECVGEGRTLHIERLFAEITKYSKMVVDPQQLLSALQEAEYHLLEGRKGPIHLCIPIDILQTKIEFEDYLPKLTCTPPVMTGEQEKQLYSLVAQSEKPLLLVGAGCQETHTAEIVRRIANMGVAVGTTLRGKGVLDENHGMAIGCIGMYGESAANYYLDRETDLIVAVGVSMSEFTTQCWDRPFQKTPLVHVDIDASQIGKNYKPVLGVHSEANSFLSSLEKVMQAHKIPEASSFAVQRARQKFVLKREEPEVDSAIMTAQEAVETISPVAVIRLLDRLMPADRTIWVSDSVTWTETNLKSKGPRSHIEAVNQASIGYTPAAAIGAKIACPDRFVTAVFGDGGFRQTGLELASAVSYKIPVLWTMLNNEKYGSIYAAQKSYYGGNIVGTTYSPIDYVKFSQSLGMEARLICNEEQLIEAVNSFLNEERPMLLDIRIDESLPVAKTRQLVRYQQWKLASTPASKDPEASASMLKQLIKNRY